MNENKYKNLCRSLNHILKKCSDDDYIIETPQLHLVRNTEEYTSIFSVIDEDGISYKKLFISTIKKPELYFSGLIRLIKSVKDIRFKNQKVSNLHDIVFISHIFDAKQGRNQDLYFSGLYDILNKKGIKFSVVYYDSSYNGVEEIQNLNPNDYLLQKIGTVWNEFLVTIKQVKKSIILLRKAFAMRKENKYEMGIYVLASVLSFSGWAFELEYRKRFFEKLFKNFKPKKIILTHEGLAWERIVSMKYHELVVNGKILAYQHVPIFSSSNSIKQSFNKNADPDIIMFSSELYLNHFNKFKDNKFTTKTVSLGNVRYKDRSGDFKSDLTRENCIYLLPLGSHSETIKYIKLAKDLSKLLQSYIIIISIHPLLKKAKNIEMESNKLIVERMNARIYQNEKDADGYLHNCFVISSGSSAFIPFCQRGGLPILYSYKSIDSDLSSMQAFDELIPTSKDIVEISEMVINYDRYYSIKSQKYFFDISKKIYDKMNNKLFEDLINE